MRPLPLRYERPRARSPAGLAAAPPPARHPRGPLHPTAPPCVATHPSALAAGPDLSPRRLSKCQVSVSLFLLVLFLRRPDCSQRDTGEQGGSVFGGKRGLHPRIASFLLPEHRRPRCRPRGPQEAAAMVSEEGFASSSDLNGLALPSIGLWCWGHVPRARTWALPPPRPESWLASGPELTSCQPCDPSGG